MKLNLFQQMKELDDKRRGGGSRKRDEDDGGDDTEQSLGVRKRLKPNRNDNRANRGKKFKR